MLLQSMKFWWYLLLSSSMLLHDIMTSFSIYLFTVPVNLVYVKLWGLATKKILIKNLPCMIEKGTEGIRRQKQMKKFCLKGWSKSALSCSVVSTRDKSHTRTVVRECCKGDEASQWRNPKFDPPPRPNPVSDRNTNRHRWLCRGPIHLCNSSSRSAQAFRFCACVTLRTKNVLVFLGSCNSLKPRALDFSGSRTQNLISRPPFPRNSAILGTIFDGT